MNFLAILCVLTCWGYFDECGADEDGQINILYTVENTLNVSSTFHATIGMTTVSQPFFNIMQEAAGENSTFRFNSTGFGKLGQYITSVNGLEADSKQELFWAFMLRCDNGDCLMGVGVSSFLPSDGDHVVLSYQRYSIFNQLPTCQNVSAHCTV